MAHYTRDELLRVFGYRTLPDDSARLLEAGREAQSELLPTVNALIANVRSSLKENNCARAEHALQLLGKTIRNLNCDLLQHYDAEQESLQKLNSVRSELALLKTDILLAESTSDLQSVRSGLIEQLNSKLISEGIADLDPDFE